MTFAELFTIGCFISLNPSPIHWMVSGGEAEVAAVTGIAGELPAVRLVAHASAARIGFARFEFAADAPYRAIARLYYEAQRHQLLASFPQPLVPSCDDGGVDEIGHPGHPVTVGLVGDEAAVAAIRQRLTWARFLAVRLADGRAAWAFRPDAESLDPYRAFVADAAAGAIAGIDIVLLHAAR